MPSIYSYTTLLFSTRTETKRNDNPVLPAKRDPVILLWFSLSKYQRCAAMSSVWTLVASTRRPATPDSAVLKPCVVKLRLGVCPNTSTSGLVAGSRRASENAAF